MPQRANAKDPDKGNQRLSAAAARRIRESSAAGARVLDLANQYGVSDQAVKDVLNFETWAGAGGPKRPQKLPE